MVKIVELFFCLFVLFGRVRIFSDNIFINDRHMDNVFFLLQYVLILYMS